MHTSIVHDFKIGLFEDTNTADMDDFFHHLIGPYFLLIQLEHHSLPKLVLHNSHNGSHYAWWSQYLEQDKIPSVMRFQFQFFDVSLFELVKWLNGRQIWRGNERLMDDILTLILALVFLHGRHHTLDHELLNELITTLPVLRSLTRAPAVVLENRLLLLQQIHPFLDERNIFDLHAESTYRSRSGFGAKGEKKVPTTTKSKPLVAIL